ncbi:bacteriocin production protein [Idiomarina sp. OT37-5b]|jgi:membrane protein required for colicin V production|uniref:Bacteriocin production protein n=1 Tax=Idiomarina aquatica TaxID=1327752 RepID=A0AA94EFI4_9GAMM|nr:MULTISPECIES: CvpA family protein [Idiomarina]AVJ55493.1 bacteriocin production protein [Idiomarina sp. OT37-5b]RUO44888.1 bacteriocin production protein [Idiomarina aquatica]
MLWIDFSIIGIIAISTLVSLVRGFIKEAVSLVIWVAAFFIASQFYQDLAVYITQLQDPMLRNGAAIAILFVVTLILGAIVNYILSKLVEHTGLSGTDRVLGLVFGALRGVLIVAALLFFMDSFTGLSDSQWWQDSVLIPHFGVFIQWFFEYLETSSSFLVPKPV